MEYVEIKDNLIIGHYCGDMPEEENPVIEYRIIENCAANIGDDIRIYSDARTGIKKPLTQLVKEGFVPVLEGKTLNESGTDFIDITEAENVAAGLIQLKPDEKVENNYIVSKTKKEFYDEGILSKEAYNLYIDGLRQAAYSREAEPLGMQVLRDEVDKAEWLAKIEEVEQRYPQIE